MWISTHVGFATTQRAPTPYWIWSRLTGLFLPVWVRIGLSGSLPALTSEILLAKDSTDWTCHVLYAEPAPSDWEVVRRDEHQMPPTGQITSCWKQSPPFLNQQSQCQFSCSSAVDDVCKSGLKMSLVSLNGKMHGSIKTNFSSWPPSVFWVELLRAVDCPLGAMYNNTRFLFGKSYK